MTAIRPLLDRMDRMTPRAMRRVTLHGQKGTPSFGRRTELDAHLEMLAEEFAGRTLLEFAHAVAIVRIRRGLDLEAALARFGEIWEEEAAFLLDRLDSRWLVSACDTWLERGPDERDRAYGLAGTLFANALKLAETERLMAPEAPAADPGRIPNDRPTPLYDGVTAFVPAGGDMLRNLEARLDALDGGDAAARPSARVVRELYARAKRNDTVIRRMHAHQAALRRTPATGLRRVYRLPRRLLSAIAALP